MVLRSGGLLCISLFLSCRPGDIIDDWGTAGYARLQGSVTRANGSGYANGSLFYSCEPSEPDSFGRFAAAAALTTTNADARFDILVNAPMPGTLPPSGILVCEVQAGAPPFASARASVPFSAAEADRPTTVINLIEVP